MAADPEDLGDSADPGDPGDEGDRALLAAHVAGDTEAFGTLFARHRDRLWAVALRTTGDREDAADALQDAMVSAFRRASGYRGEARVTTWLHRIVVNACLDRIRRAKVRATDPLPRSYDGSDGGPGQRPRDRLVDPDPAHDPAVRAEQSELRDRLLAALAELPTEQRAALVLVDVQGYPVEEAAAVLGCAVGTVKSRCSRGRARLAVLLSPAPGTDPPPGSSHPEEVT